MFLHPRPILALLTASAVLIGNAKCVCGEAANSRAHCRDSLALAETADHQTPGNRKSCCAAAPKSEAGLTQAQALSTQDTPPAGTPCDDEREPCCRHCQPALTAKSGNDSALLTSAHNAGHLCNSPDLLHSCTPLCNSTGLNSPSGSTPVPPWGRAILRLHCALLI